MFTVCPKCALTLVVTAADLRVAQGYVRCGRCSNVFNAIVALSEERQAAAGSGADAGAVTGSTASTSIIRQAPSLAEDIASDDPLSVTSETEILYAEPDADETAPAQPEAGEEPPPAPYDDAATFPETALEYSFSEADIEKVFVEPGVGEQDESTGTYESIVLHSEDSPPDEAPSDPEADELESELRSLAARLEATDDGHEAGQPAASEAGVEPEAAVDTALAFPAHEMSAAATDAAAEAFAPARPRRARLALWATGIALLCATLAVQVVHHNRQDLATNARLNRPLTRFYTAIGLPLVPHWNLHSYEVRQLGASTGDGVSGNLIVRASLKNDADQPLPLPLLRITVQDRYGNRIARRDVPPRAYVPGAVPEDAHLGVGQRIDAEMKFRDPGRDAVGFEIDACLPQAGGYVACANDPARP